MIKSAAKLVWVAVALALVILVALSQVAQVSAQEQSKPEFVLAFVPVRWSGSLEEFDREATRQAQVFIRESGIEKYATVQLHMIHDRLDNVDLKTELVPKVVEFGLRRIPADRYVGLTDGDLWLGSDDVAGYTRGPDAAGVLSEAGDDAIVAHELGHTFGLCDEYSYATWSLENAAWGCPNSYPDHCPRTNRIDCRGTPTENGGTCIMGHAGQANLREFDQACRDHLDKVFQSLFGQGKPPITPTATASPTRPSAGSTATPAPPTAVPPTPLPQYIAYTNDQEGTYQLYTLLLGGDAPRRVSGIRGEVTNPGWSPDGGHIAFASTMNGNLDIYIADAGGGRLTRLTDTPSRDEWPVWSPDGRHIAFVSDREGSPQVYLMNRDGSSQQRVTTGPGRHINPSWAPDGRHMAVAGDYDGHLQIYALSLQIASSPAVITATQLTKDPSNSFNPSWSPDGRFVAFTSDRDANLELYVLDVQDQLLDLPATEQPIRVTQNLDQDWAPAWLQGSNALIYHKAVDGLLRLYVVGLGSNSGQERLVVNTPGSSAWPVPRP